MRSSFSLAARVRSFGYAIKGIIAFVQSEHNAWIHLLATIVVVPLGFYFGINTMEWIAIAIVMGLVWITEMLNTCVEKIMDTFTNEKRPSIAFIKSANAVLKFTKRSEVSNKAIISKELSISNFKLWSRAPRCEIFCSTALAISGLPSDERSTTALTRIKED